MEKLQLENFGLVEMSSDEIAGIDGLGFLADLVADVVEYYKCKCKESPSITESPILGTNPTHFM